METILYLAENPSDARALVAELAGRYSVVYCTDEASTLDAARRNSKPAAIVVDPGPSRARRRDAAGTRSIWGIRRLAGNVPLIAILEPGDEGEVGALLRKQADLVISRPCGLGKMRAAVDTAIGISALRGAAPFDGSSPAIRAAADKLRLYAASDYPVLILGESGTGKEIAARAIHGLSARRRGPFVDRNCSALPELLAESELFGTERGAFTDAVARPGAFELAKGGVLFLDEIGDAGLPLQAKLLRIIESGQCWRLGASRPVEVDVRIVSATSAGLRRAAAEGRFRSDLFFRIETLVLELPPLRERREDIPGLALRIALEASHGSVDIGPGALDKLYSHDWPGNVRELRNVVHRALVLAGGAGRITEDEVEF